ncbi:unnamed protein product [Effrenium voratum]|uniref:Uncharacterized protein n=1 Tax=Effrenium voratum TaxID=2562239 RepID=A0AA36I3H2_9DINO|nr:unnamed protein product [Effrenium voratum]
MDSSEQRSEKLTWIQLPESSLIDILRALLLNDIFNVTACDKRWLLVGNGAPHFPVLDDMPLAVMLLPPLKSRLPRVKSLLCTHIEDWQPLYAPALKTAGHLIQQLVMRLSENIGESELVHILTFCPCLRRFELTDYDLVGALTGDFLKHLPAGLAELRLCLIRFLHDAGLKAAVEAAPQLQSVCLEGVDELTSPGMCALADLRLLTELSLVCTRAAAVPQVSEEALLCILACESRLQALEVSEKAGPPLSLQAGGDHFMKALGKHSLRSLSLSGVVGISDSALRLLATSCPELRELSLFRPGNQISSGGLQQALESLPCLESLSLGCVADFPGAFGAVQAAHRLKSLEMTRYFRTAAEVSLVSVLRKLQASFPCLSSAVFRGSFSAEQVSACRMTLEIQPDEDLQLQWQQLDEQTFWLQWFSEQESRFRVSVQLQRCFRETDFL